MFALLLRASAMAQPDVPQTPAGRVFAAWLAAFNSVDPERIRAFDVMHREKAPPLEGTLGFRAMTGGFTLVRIEQSEPTTIVALVREKDSDTIGRIEMTVSAGDPPKIVTNEPARSDGRPTSRFRG